MKYWRIFFFIFNIFKIANNKIYLLLSWMFNAQIHRKVYLFGSIVLAAALTLSPFSVSVSLFLLAANWLAEGNFHAKLRILLKRKSIILIVSVYLIHLLWLLNSQNLQYGIHDLKIKLPLFALPIIYGTTEPFTRKELNYIFHAYLLSCLVAILISAAIYFNLTQFEIRDIREISPIISHIRLSLLIVLAAYLIISYLIFYPEEIFLPKYYYFIVLSIFLIFIPWMGAVTGSVILLLVMPVAVILWLRNKKSNFNYLIGIAIIILISGGCIGYLYYSYNRFMDREVISEEKLPSKTINGNFYLNDVSMQEFENRYQVWILICNVELEKEWNLRSKYNYTGQDLKGQNLQSTLLRYMTSLGLTKDSVGISKLSNEDIKMVENGYTNYLFKNKWSVYTRLYQIFWEIEHYIDGGNPSGHSLTQRVEYLKNSIRVIKRNFWFGTGTGDTEREIKKQYEIDDSNLEPNWRNRTHNQLVTFFLTFGLIGFLLIIFVLTMAIYLERKNIDFIFICFFLIFLLSTLNEDTLETQIGATYYAFFLSLLLLGRSLERKPNNKSS